MSAFKKMISHIKKSIKRLGYLDKTQSNLFGVLIFIAAFLLFTGATYAYFTITKNMGAATLTIAKLNYELSSENSSFQNNSITVSAGTTLLLDLNIKSLNTAETKYALNYESTSSDLKLYYVESRDQNVQGIISSTNSIIPAHIVLVNEGTTDATVTFNVKGGYTGNDLTSNITELYVSTDVTVTFEPNGGTLETTTKVVPLNELYGELPVPTYKGYIFKGWWTALTGGENITESSSLTSETNHTLYAHWEKISGEVTLISNSFADTLIKKANPASITAYTDESATATEMFKFTHEATDQTAELTDYRYIGTTPNNYVSFNGEKWRIIGVMPVENESGTLEYRVKIVRIDTIDGFGWDTNNKNNWPTSTSAATLNGDYYNRLNSYSSKGLDDTARAQIGISKWYLGGIDTTIGSADDYYGKERGIDVYGTNDKNYNTYVGMIYPSDYTYSFGYGVDEMCFTDGSKCASDGTPSNSWLFKAAYLWTITSQSASGIAAIILGNNGIVGYYPNGVTPSFGVRPTTYLRANITTTEGNGTSSTPYVLSN